MSKRCCFPLKAPRGRAGRGNDLALGGCGSGPERPPGAPAAQGRTEHREAARHIATQNPSSVPQPIREVLCPLPAQVEASSHREKQWEKPLTLHVSVFFGRGLLPQICALMPSPSPPS